MKSFKQLFLENAYDAREYAKKGYIHPEDAQHHKVGSWVDFYDKDSGDKKYGKVLKNNGKAIHIARPLFRMKPETVKFKIGHPE